MNAVYDQIRIRAVQIASRYPPPAFYADHMDQVDYSLDLFMTDPEIGRLRRHVTGDIDNDFGHGLAHSIKVALDAGTLVAIEMHNQNPDGPELARRVRMAHCAGLLHDIRRKDPDHAARGARYAGSVLKDYEMESADAEDICIAIGNHEAFSSVAECRSATGALVSDCLYDADKFRMGPENFTHTVWEMLSFADVPLSVFMAEYPRGMEFLGRIRHTFRSPTGRVYGPKFIDLGLAIGRELYDWVRSEFD
jgi:hypothetical protein